MKRINAIQASLLAVAALSLAAFVVAQPFGMPGYGRATGPGTGFGQGPDPGASAFDPAVMVETRLATIRAQLAILPAQEGAWNAFADAARQQAQDMQAARAAMWQSSPSAPDRLAQRASIMQQRAAGMATVAAALRSLYDVLTPQQRTILDARFAGGRGPRFGPFAG